MPSGQSVLQAPQSRQLKMRSSSTSEGSISLSNSFSRSTILPRGLIPSFANSILVGQRALQLPHRTQRFCPAACNLFRSDLSIEVSASEAFHIGSDMFEPEFAEALCDP